MTIPQAMRRFVRGLTRNILLTLLGMLALPGDAQASIGQTLSNAWKCASAVASAPFKITADVAVKAAKVIAHADEIAACAGTSAVDTGPFAVVLGAIGAIKLASPDTLPNGQCKSRIHNAMAKPFAYGLSAVVPFEPAHGKLVSLAQSDAAGQAVWDGLSGFPATALYTNHVDCACILIDDALNLVDVQQVVETIEDVGGKCSNFLDDIGLGIISDVIGAAGRYAHKAYSDVSGSVDGWAGQDDPVKPDDVYQEYYGRFVDQYVFDRLQFGKQLPETKVKFDWGNTTADLTLVGQYANCVEYYDEHKASISTGQQRCNAHLARFKAAYEDQVRSGLGHKEIGQYAVAGGFTNAIAKDYGWRMPARKTAWSAGDIYAVMLPVVGGAPKFDPKYNLVWEIPLNGVYASADTLLPNFDYAGGLALKAAYAGANGAFMQLARAEWDRADRVTLDNSGVTNVYHEVAAETYLKPWMPAADGRYGCSGQYADACVDVVRATFHKACYPKIADAMALASSVQDTLPRILAVRAACIERLSQIATPSYKPPVTSIAIQPLTAAANATAPLPSALDTGFRKIGSPKFSGRGSARASDIPALRIPAAQRQRRPSASPTPSPIAPR